VHVILLLPAIRFLQVDQQVPIAPFLYIAPVLLTVPFVSHFLWETDIYDSPVLVRAFELFLSAEKVRAARELARDSPRLLQIVKAEAAAPEQQAGAQYESSEVGRDPLQRLAYLRLVAKADPGVLAAEAMALKRRRAGKATALSSIASGRASSLLPPVASMQPGTASPLDAAKALVDAISSLEEEAGTGNKSGMERDAAVLGKLQELQRQLEDDSEKP